MMYYFQVRFKDTDDIYIIRIACSKMVCGIVDAKEAAKRRIIEEFLVHATLHFRRGLAKPPFHVTEDDFEIKELTLQNLVSQFHFANDIAQLNIIRNP